MTGKAQRAQYSLEFKLEAVRLVKAGQCMAAVECTSRCSLLSQRTSLSRGLRTRPYQPRSPRQAIVEGTTSLTIPCGPTQ